MFEDFVASAEWLKSRPDCTLKSASWVSALAEQWPIDWRCNSRIWQLRFVLRPATVSLGCCQNQGASCFIRSIGCVSPGVPACRKR